MEDWFRVFANNAKQPWIADINSATPHIQIDSGLFDWVDKCKRYYDNGWMGTTALWSDEWSFDQTYDGKVFGFFYSTWGINFTLVGNAGEEGFGDWAVCEGPAAWYWGGTWIAGARGTDNASLVADIIRKMTCDKDNMVAITKGTEIIRIQSPVCRKSRIPITSRHFWEGRTTSPCFRMPRQRLICRLSVPTIRD